VSDDVPVTLQDMLVELQQLIEGFDDIPDPAVKRGVFRVLDLLDLLHREGLTRVAGGLTATGFFDKALDDPVVAHLFGIYGLLPGIDPQAAVEEALVELAPYFESHGGSVRLLGIEGGVVDVAMEGACDGCPSSEITLFQAIDDAVRLRWPALVRIRVLEPPPSGGASWQPVSIQPR
jgi:Fe-S cluster biogenesis protein NfuA